MGTTLSATQGQRGSRDARALQITGYWL